MVCCCADWIFFVIFSIITSVVLDILRIFSAMITGGLVSDISRIFPIVSCLVSVVVRVVLSLSMVSVVVRFVVVVVARRRSPARILIIVSRAKLIELEFSSVVKKKIGIEVWTPSLRRTKKRLLPGVVAVLEFVPEVVVVLGQSSVLQVVIEATVLVHCRHRLHYHSLVAALPPALQSRLPRLETPAGLTKPDLKHGRSSSPEPCRSEPLSSSRLSGCSTDQLLGGRRTRRGGCCRCCRGDWG